MAIYWANSFLRNPVAVWSLGLALATSLPGAEYRLVADPDSGLVRCKVVLEVQGTLRSNAEGKAVTQLPLKVDAQLVYDERSLPPDRYAGSHVRDYRQAEATIRIGESQVKSTLPEQHRRVLVRTKNSRATLSAVGASLSRSELDLIDVQANGVLLPRLLPAEPVDVGATWEPNTEALASVLALEAITENKVTARLHAIKDDLAEIHFTGTASGAVGGIGTDLELNAKCNFDLKEKRITWFVLAVKEDRAIGHAEPGFLVTAQLRYATMPVKTSDIADVSLLRLPTEHLPAMDRLEFRAVTGMYRFTHDRRWRLMVDRPDGSVLRLVDRGDLLAQFNVSKLPSLGEGKQQSMEAFQQDIGKALSKHSGQVIESSEWKSTLGLRVLEVSAQGNASELPIRWHFYHVSDSQGRRASFVFTFEEKLLERFAGIDRELLESFEFLEPTGTPKVAKQPAGDGPARK